MALIPGTRLGPYEIESLIGSGGMGEGPGLIQRVEPRYPPIAQSARIEGTVVVDAVIRKDGTVSDVAILTSTNRVFDQSCMDAVRQWRFTPGSQDVVLTVTVNFTLK